MALKVSISSAAQWVVEAQAAIQRGATLARADLKEPVTQGEATKAATKPAGEEAPMSREAGALVSGEAEAPSIAEATEGEVEVGRGPLDHLPNIRGAVPRASASDLMSPGGG